MNLQKTAFGLILLASVAFAEAPRTMLFQGSVSKSGTALTGSHKVVIDICESGNVDDDNCTQIYTNDKVTFLKGYYSVTLGEKGELPVFDKPYFLQVSVDGTTPDNRIPLTSAPSALNAIRADSAAVAKVANAVATDVAVTSINGLKNAVTIEASQGVSLSTSGTKLIIKGTDITNISNTSVTTKDLVTNDAKIKSFTPGQGGIATCDASNSGLLLNVSDNLLLCSKATGSYQWNSVAIGGDNAQTSALTTQLISFTPGVGGIATCDESHSGMIMNISGSLTMCSKNNTGIFQWSIIASSSESSALEFSTARITPYIPGPGGYASCTANNEGTIAYLGGSTAGNFLGCVKTATNTYSWKTLNNP